MTSHRFSKTSTYHIWQGMKARTSNPNYHNYPRYGGRGIGMCERWQKFENFLADMGPRPEGMTLERENNDKGYEPGNCVWADLSTQGRNKRSNVLLTVDGITMPLVAWAKRVGLKYKTLHTRISQGWSHEDAVKRPNRYAKH